MANTAMTAIVAIGVTKRCCLKPAIAIAYNSLSASAAGQRSSTPADAAGASDSLSAGADRPRVADEAIGAGDSLSATISATRGPADVAQATDELVVELVGVDSAAFADFAAAADELLVTLLRPDDARPGLYGRLSITRTPVPHLQIVTPKGTLELGPGDHGLHLRT